MSATLRTSGGLALKSFRLADVPEHIRVEAALAHADELHRALKTRDGRVPDRREGFAAIDSASAAMRLALHPTDHVYRVTQKAWDTMLERARKRRP